MVTLGKLSPEMECVEMLELMGDSDQLTDELLMSTPVITKLDSTMIEQTTLATLGLAVLMWTSPWMVEPSRNSLRGFMVRPRLSNKHALPFL